MTGFEQKQSLAQTSDLVRPAQHERDIARPAAVTDPLVAEQQAIGNQAMLRFAESCPLTLPSASICPYGGVCDTCPAPIQTKLNINKPGDKYEQEADRIADQIMRRPEPQLQRQPVCKDEECEETIQPKPLADQITPLIQRQPEEEEEKEEEEFLQSKSLDGWPTIYGGIESQFIQRQPEEEEEKEEEELLQTKTQSGSTPVVTPGIEANINSLKGRGQPLDPETRAFMEPRFGKDFSDIRIHADSQAANLARSVNSRAFTVGRNIAFGAGQYQPQSDTGRRLLVHEMTHVVQQTSRTGKVKSESMTDLNLIQRSCDNGIYKRVIDGCGLPGIIALLKGVDRNNPAGGDDTHFSHIGEPGKPNDRPCDEHDRCAGESEGFVGFDESKRARCDSEFYNHMKRVCNDSIDESRPVTIKPRPIGPISSDYIELPERTVNVKDVKERCSYWADYYYEKVSEWGYYPFLNEQWKAGVCELGIWDDLKIIYEPWLSNEPYGLVHLGKIKGRANSKGLWRDLMISMYNVYSNTGGLDSLKKNSDQDFDTWRASLQDGDTERTLAMDLARMAERGSDWESMKAKIKDPAYIEQRADLYKFPTMMKFFVKECNNKEMADAVDLLGGTLLQKLTWMEAEGSNWELIREKIEIAPVSQREELYDSPTMLEFFVRECTNKEMIDAVNLLGGTLDQKLAWMKVEDYRVEDMVKFAESLENTYPNWLNSIPDCPCTLEKARQSSEFKETHWLIVKSFTRKYHPGAAYEFRTITGYPSIHGSSHGQQCIYNAEGSLVVEGAGAGTPDLWSPETHFLRHQKYDVKPWRILGWDIYNRYWIPNRGSGCTGVPPGSKKK